MKKYSVIIDTELCNNLTCAYYLLNGQKSIMTSILTNPNLNLNETMFSKYSDEYIYSYMNYEEYKKYLEDHYVGQTIPLKSNYSWTLDFNTSKLIVEFDDESDYIDSELKKKGFERIE